MSFNESGLIESKNATISASSNTGVWEDSRTSLGGLVRAAGLYSTTSSGNRRATGRPPSVASASTCFPDADPTRPPRDRLLRLRAQADGQNKKPKMSAKPPDKRFAYWDCAHGLPRALAMSPRFWLGPILKFPLIDQRESEALLQSLFRILLRHRPFGRGLLRGPLRPATASLLFSSPPEWRLHFRLGLESAEKSGVKPPCVLVPAFVVAA
jgi:hypothetical protein